jgi:hypothetical protein
MLKTKIKRDGMTITLGNPVWKRFITTRIGEWLIWSRSIHIDSHLHLWERYTENFTADEAAQRALKNISKPSDEESLIEKLLLPPDSFWAEMETLAGEPHKIVRMYKVSLSATIDDILFELSPYSESFDEIEKIVDFMSRKSAWFDALLNHFRGYQYNLLKEAEKL